MKRVPLKRYQGLKRSAKGLKKTGRLNPVSKKRAKRNRKDRSVLDEFRETFTQCAVCWCSEHVRALVIHHLCHPNRRNIRAGLLRCCTRCHDHYHRCGELDARGRRLAKLTPGNMPWAKREADPEGWNLEEPLGLLGKKSLGQDWQPKPLPQWALTERKRNQP